MIRPCFDLQGGEVVQLVKGETLALSEPVETALGRFDGFPLVHVIDLDAAKAEGDNLRFLPIFAERYRVRFGGGVRSVATVRKALELGAEQVILGSAAFRSNSVNTELLEQVTAEAGKGRVVVAMDLKGGQVAVAGWRETVPLSASEALEQLEGRCGGVLCTHVDREGQMRGADLDLFLGLRRQTDLPFIAAGGITTLEEVDVLTGAGIEVALGMALYTGRLPLGELQARMAAGF